MKKQIAIILLLFLLIILTGIFYYQHAPFRSQHSNQKLEKNDQRIISLSPNITEILFALGLGEKVVGVTRFCNYPQEARAKMQVGGYLDPNYEAIVRLQPDVVILLSEFDLIKTLLSELGIHYLTVNNKTVSDILASIESIGKEFGAIQQADRLVVDMRQKIDRIKARTQNAIRPNVLIVVERTLGTGVIEDVYVAGRNTFYDELLEIAGGMNAYQSEKIAYPILSAEGIIHLNPDFIIELVPQLAQTGLSPSLLEQDWQSLGQINAVKSDQIFIMSEDYAVVPGPRFILFLEDLARLIHPEFNREGKQ